MRLHQCADEAEAEAGSFAPALPAAETLEQLLGLSELHAWAVIAHGNIQDTVAKTEFQVMLTADWQWRRAFDLRGEGALHGSALSLTSVWKSAATRAAISCRFSSLSCSGSPSVCAHPGRARQPQVLLHAHPVEGNAKKGRGVEITEIENLVVRNVPGGRSAQMVMDRTTPFNGWTGAR